MAAKRPALFNHCQRTWSL